MTAAFRPIPEKIPALEDLGLPDAISQIAKVKQGLVLVTGPTGHGKTTTQAALTDREIGKRIAEIQWRAMELAVRELMEADHAR